MAQSLVKLTLESNQYEKNLRQAQKSLNDFTKQIGVNTKALSGIAVAAGAVTGAMKVMKDAFFASETALDEWGRTVKSAQSLYDGFLSALNNTDISGFLSRMDDIVSAARNAYNAMDELGTYSAFNQRNVAKARSGYAAALDAYKLNPTAENKQALAAANQQVLQDLRDSHQKTEDAYQAALKNLATTRLSSKELQDAFVKTFSSGSYADLKNAKSFYSTGSGLNAGAQYYYGNRVYDGRIQDRSTGKWRDMSADEKKQFEFARALSQVNDEQIKEVQALGAQSEAIQEAIANQNRQYNRLAGNNAKASAGGGGGRSSISRTADVYAPDSIAAQQALVAELTKKWQNAGAAVRDGYKKELKEAQITLANMIEGRNFLTPDLSTIQGTPLLGPKQEDLNKMVSQLKLPRPEDKQLKVAYADKELSNMSSGISSMVGSLEQLGVEIPEGLSQVVSGIQAVTTILSAITTIVTAIQAIQTADLIIPSWLARGGIVHAASGYFVPGNSYSGDRVPALLNSGELVLNKAQQGNLASQLAGGALGNLQLEATVTGEQIRFVLNNNGRRTGRGEMITAKFGG